MDTVQLFAQNQGATGYSSYSEIDLYASDPIRITKSVQELEDPDANTSNYSQNFRVPHTSSNGQFFKMVFNVNSTDFDATIKSDAYINVNGTYFMGGNIRLTSIFVNNKTNKVDYNIIFIGETGTFSGIVGTKQIKDLNLTDYNHPVTLENIEKSWDLQLFNGDILYPLAEWGYDYASGGAVGGSGAVIPIQSTLSKYDSVSAVKGFTNSNHPLSLGQFKPAIKAKVVWDKIFEEAGFTYSSDFIDTTLDKLYTISANEAKSITVTDSGCRVLGASQLGSTVSLGSVEWVYYLNDVYDPSNAFNDGVYTCTYTSNQYNFRMALDAYASVSAFPVSEISLGVIVNGIQITSAQGEIYLPGGGNVGGGYAKFGTNDYIDFPLSLEVGDKVKFFIYADPLHFVNLQLVNGELTVTGPEIVNQSGYLHDSFTQIGFIKSITSKFKLVWEPDPVVAKNFLIEPWKDWVTDTSTVGGVQKDWTDKLDENKDLEIGPLFKSQERNLTLKDADDNDIYNKAFKESYQKTFGQLDIDSGIELVTGTKNVSTIFAPIPLAPIANYTDFLVPHFATDSETRRSPMKLKPRLFFYNGLQTAPLTWHIENVVGGATVPKAFTQYPVISQFDKYPFNTSSFDLNFDNNDQYWDLANVGFDGRTAKTAYTEYWQKWYESTYDPYGRKMSATFKLDYDDIAQLKFNDIIFVKDSYWTPLKIYNFALGKSQSVKVDFLKLGEIGVKITPGTTGPPSNLTYLHRALCFGSNVCEACCCENRERYNVYSNESTLPTSTLLFKDPTAGIPADAGFYSDGTFAYEVDSTGTILFVHTCSGCGCEPTNVYEYDTVYGSTLYDSTCGSTYTDIVYGDGNSLDTSKNIYGTTGGGATASGYYRGITGDIIHVNSTGTQVDYTLPTTLCNCNEAGHELMVSISTDEDGACCFGTTGDSSIQNVYYDDTFDTATGFWYDPYYINVVGATATAYITDGIIVKEVLDAAPSDRPDCNPNDCSNRTNKALYTITNESGSHISIDTTIQISWDNAFSWLKISDNTDAGTGFTAGHTGYYSSSNYGRAYVYVPGGSGGTLTATTTKGGTAAVVDNLSLDGDYTTPFGVVDSSTYAINIEWTP